MDCPPENNNTTHSSPTTKRRYTTVQGIRLKVKTKSENDSSGVESLEPDDLVFHIFDGSPDADSPWAKFIDQDGYSDKEDGDEEDGDNEEDGNELR